MEVTMSRYFFRLRDGDDILPDDGEGQEFPNMDAVRIEAFACARDMLSEAAWSGKGRGLEPANRSVERSWRDRPDNSCWQGDRDRKPSVSCQRTKGCNKAYPADTRMRLALSGPGSLRMRGK